MRTQGSVDEKASPTPLPQTISYNGRLGGSIGAEYHWQKGGPDDLSGIPHGSGRGPPSTRLGGALAAPTAREAILHTVRRMRKSVQAKGASGAQAVKAML